MSISEYVLVEQVCDSLSNVDTASRVCEAEVTTPEVVTVVELDLVKVVA